jgi:tetratricopeptide (TPR) repeat protein
MSTLPFVLLATLAQATAPSATPESKAIAQSLLNEGTRLYDRREFAPALDKFTAAYATYASPKLLYNIAQTYRALGRSAEAMDAFERFLLQAPDALAEMTTEVHSSMAELQAKLGRIHIECSKPRAEISIDGKLVGLSPLQDLVWAEPGRHQVTARHADAIPVVQDVEVAIGSVRNVVLDLQPLDAVPVVNAQRLPVPAGVRPQPPQLPLTAEAAQAQQVSQGWWLGRRWTWVAAGSTVALAAAAAIVGASMQSRFDSLNQSCGSASADYPGCSEDDVRGVDDRKTAANVLWALSGAAAATTGILFFVEGRSVAPTTVGSLGIGARVAY